MCFEHKRLQDYCHSCGLSIADLLFSQLLVLSSSRVFNPNQWRPQLCCRLTFVASLFTFVAVQLWGLRTSTLTAYMLWSPWAELHTLTCLPGLCIHVCVDLDRVALLNYCPNSSTVLHIPSPLPLGHYRGIGGQWGNCFKCTHTHSHTYACTYPWIPLSVACWSVPLDWGQLTLYE